MSVYLRFHFLGLSTYRLHHFTPHRCRDLVLHHLLASRDLPFSFHRHHLHCRPYRLKFIFFFLVHLWPFILLLLLILLHSILFIFMSHGMLVNVMLLVYIFSSSSPLVMYAVPLHPSSCVLLYIFYHLFLLLVFCRFPYRSTYLPFLYILL